MPATPRRLPPFSALRSSRETSAFVCGLLVLAGAFAPWFRATRVDDPPMSPTTLSPETVYAALPAAWAIAILAAVGLALGLAPLPKPWKPAIRGALFAVAFLVCTAAALLGPSGFPFAWGGVFHDYVDIRPAWGVVFVAAGSFGAAVTLLWRARDAASADADDAPSAG